MAIREEIEERHESFGVAVITRCGGGRTRLFGTGVESVPTYMELEVRRAAMRFDRDTLTQRVTEDYDIPANERYIVRMRMSAAQFAELITNVGVMPGIPVTLTRVAGRQMQGVPETHMTELEKIQREAEEDESGRVDAEQHAAVAKIRELVRDRIPKKDMPTFDRLLSSIQHGGASSAKWSMQRFREATTEMVSHARMEVHAAMTAVVTALGRAALARGETPELPNELPRRD